jgi:hypothetical protein
MGLLGIRVVWGWVDRRVSESSPGTNDHWTLPGPGIVFATVSDDAGQLWHRPCIGKFTLFLFDQPDNPDPGSTTMADNKDKIKEGIDDAADKAKDATEKAADKAGDVAHDVGQKVKDAGQKIKDAGH